MSTARYAEYARQLSLLAADVRRGAWAPLTDDVHQALNGQAATKLRALVPRQVRREHGAFFTAGGARSAFEAMIDSDASSSPSSMWDPSCGAGDLLLAAARALPLASTPTRTIAAWSRLVRGNDLHERFVEVARLRLTLAALERHRQAGDMRAVSDVVAHHAFSSVGQGDGLLALDGSRAFEGRILLNPPFGPTSVGAECAWSSGKTSTAAIFAARAVECLADGGRLSAILPDVLRSGSRYASWRTYLDEKLLIDSVLPHGLFDEHTDVDVFLLQGRRLQPGEHRKTQWWQESASGTTVGEVFDVRVGSVVDNRDPHEGTYVPFLTARGLPPHGVTGLPERQRHFAGTLLKPPFVVIRRTSRPGPGPGGGTRGMGVLVTGDALVAVDNHLITVRPLDGQEETCQELLDCLARPAVSTWLDERIRCRHLTVGVVRTIPWQSD